jgi:pectate lyase
VDIKRGSSYITVSCNHADGTNKTMLLGRDDADSAQDTGRVLVTYHHNSDNDTGDHDVAAQPCSGVKAAVIAGAGVGRISV